MYDHTKDSPPHQHGGTDAPECTTCEPFEPLKIKILEMELTKHTPFIQSIDGLIYCSCEKFGPPFANRAAHRNHVAKEQNRALTEFLVEDLVRTQANKILDYNDVDRKRRGPESIFHSDNWRGYERCLRDVLDWLSRPERLRVPQSAKTDQSSREAMIDFGTWISEQSELDVMTVYEAVDLYLTQENK